LKILFYFRQHHAVILQRHTGSIKHTA
jgi:hypothetical protein